MNKLLSFCVLAGLLPWQSYAAIAPRVDITAGTLEGGICENAPDAVYFKSIPYAHPPINDLRFAPPRMYDKKYGHGVRNATVPAPSCIQFGKGPFGEPKPWSEDCLYLDIWAPSRASRESMLPVRVWIYGGSNKQGGISDPTYDGCAVARSGAIMVSINYRLGPLGFLTSERADIGGNQGIQDILLGLQWVQDNIAAFGGDPRKVMLHGQSAGATDVFTVASLPRASKLISAVIMESGGGRDGQTAHLANFIGEKFAAGLNCNAANATCLRKSSLSDIQTVFNKLPLLHNLSLPILGLVEVNSYIFTAHVDGMVIPKQPSIAGVQVPAIFGSNELEGTLFALGQFTNASGDITVYASDYDLFLAENFGVDLVPTIKQHYALSFFKLNPYPAFFAISTVSSHASYLCPAYRGLNNAIARGVPAWTYYFAHTPNCPWYQDIPPHALTLLGPTHTAEIPFVMGETEKLPFPNGACNMSHEEVAISEFMSSAWTGMAIKQSPTSDKSAWPLYTGVDESLGLIIKDTTLPGYVNYTVCKFWDQINALQLELALNNSQNRPRSFSIE